MYSQTIFNQLLQFTLAILGKQTTNNKYYHPRLNKKKKGNVNKTSRYAVVNNLPTSLVERKLKLGRNCFVKTAKKKHFLNLQQQSC